ncbi:Glu/Leu/Phe/Val family dehydrogenase [Leisingera aquaemixtae]|uniref:Glutamate dehydrogenase n=1 Tax=Leisingera aquaemixtae TaxID=1396826 RepID=A0A0P1H5Y8_9RHOB|nr:Glu/Leu/Phe/Val dehydrogenase [Leisingera aquaemixtae]CUH98315.1 Glutamate dehydrogenase [Leisingera aquaemixtae]
MTDRFAYADDLGPEQLIELTDPHSGLRAIVVVDNTAAGPAIGGCRMAPDVTARECVRLARAMTLKNAAAGLPHGGGKSVIAADPKMPAAEKERLIRAFARAIRTTGSYIPGPDMGTDETAMAWIRDEGARSVGLPRELGGIPLDQTGATAHGLLAAARAAEAAGILSLKGARVAIQGYGAVGRWCAHRFAAAGARIVAVSDSRGGALLPDGLDPARLDAVKAGGESVAAYPGAAAADSGAVITADCDILVPAARPDVIRAGNADAIRARLVLEGANIPATEEAEQRLHARGITVVPDFIANAGGVICAAMELRGLSEPAAFETISSRVFANTAEVLAQAAQNRTLPRAAALALARRRISKAMGFRRR